jgi:hypothetical protein
MTSDKGVNTHRRWRRSGVLAVVTCLLVTGCAAQFVYNRLNFLIPWYFGTKVSLSETQEAALKSAVTDVMAWHRQTELPRYSEFLRTLARETRQPVSRQQIESTLERLEDFWAALVTELTPGAARWLGSLSPEQTDELLASFAEDDADLHEEYCEPPPEKLTRKRAKSIGRSVKYWTGSLDDSQRAIIERAAADMRPTGCDWLESRAHWRAALKKLLAENDAAAIEAPLRELMLNPERTWTDAYRSGFEANRTRLLEMFAELDATWSDEQRERAARTLEKIADEMDELRPDQAAADSTRSRPASLARYSAWSAARSRASAVTP